AARAAVLSLPQPAANISGRSRPLVTSLPTLVDATARMTLNVPHVLRDQQLPPTTRSHGVMWDLPQQEEFAQDLCKLFVACNISWNSASNAQLNLFSSSTYLKRKSRTVGCFPDVFWICSQPRRRPA
ncbi:hypothetical protein B0H17DRAFT_1230999, partial [Mycena rosella]